MSALALQTSMELIDFLSIDFLDEKANDDFSTIST